VQILGWFNAATARASRSKRSLNSVLETLMATITIKARVTSLVDVAHSARTDRRKDFIWAEFFARR